MKGEGSGTDGDSDGVGGRGVGAGLADVLDEQRYREHLCARGAV